MVATAETDAMPATAGRRPQTCAGEIGQSGIAPGLALAVVAARSRPAARWGATRVGAAAAARRRAHRAAGDPDRRERLGRLAPHGEVIKVAPVSGADGGRVDRLLVDVGDWVKAGQVVAILDPYRRREAAVQQAQAQVGVARAKLAQVQAGPKPEEVQAKEALINRSEAEVRAAERDLGRSSILLKRAAGSRQDLDDQTLKYEQARDSLDQAKAELAALEGDSPGRHQGGRSRADPGRGRPGACACRPRGGRSALADQRAGPAHPRLARRARRRPGNPRNRRHRSHARGRRGLRARRGQGLDRPESQGPHSHAGQPT